MFAKILFSLTFIVVFFGVFTNSYAEKIAKSTPEIEILDDAIMEKLAQSEATSEEQQLLNSLAGKWYYELSYWNKNDAEAQISTGTAKNEIILGGKYLLSKTNLILNLDGENIPYESWEMIGYDKSKRIFTSVRADSLHDGFVTGAGVYDEKLNVIEEKGVFKDLLDAKERSYRSVLHFEEGRTYKRTFFIAGKSGKEFKAIEINFERR